MKAYYKTNNWNVCIKVVVNKVKKRPIFSILWLWSKKVRLFIWCAHVMTRTDIQTFALHRFKSATVLNSRALHPVDFDIDGYIDSGALGFRGRLNKPTEMIQLKLTMSERDALYFEESQLSKDQNIYKNEFGLAEVSATVPFTSQLVWWLRSFGKKIEKD